MPLQIVRSDLVSMEVDALVNPTNPQLVPGGGVDRAVHQGAGALLDQACRKIGSCAPGEARITKGCNLPARYVIHTVGPVWKGGGSHEKEILVSCYRNALSLARKRKCRSIAFPLISSGVCGYPKDQALKTAVDVISDFLLHHEMLVYLVVFDRDAYRISSRLFWDIAAYIDDRYVEERENSDERRRDPGGGQAFRASSAMMSLSLQQTLSSRTSSEPEDRSEQAASLQPASARSLEEALSCLDESFSEMLLRKIDECGMSDAECYKKANIDRKLFSKIRSNPQYHPSKPTVLAFALALELPLEEIRVMLRRAGFALSRSSKFDIIVEYFVSQGVYSVFEINEALFAFDQTLIGQS